MENVANVSKPFVTNSVKTLTSWEPHHFTMRFYLPRNCFKFSCNGLWAWLLLATCLCYCLNLSYGACGGLFLTSSLYTILVPYGYMHGQTHTTIVLFFFCYCTIWLYSVNILYNNFQTHYHLFSSLSSGTLEINCSKDIKVQGVIGPCTSLEKVGTH